MSDRNHAVNTEDCSSQSLSNKISQRVACKRKKKEDYKNKNTNITHLPVLDSHMRLNFLHQGAVHISMQSSSLNDGFAKISRRYAKYFREILNTERVKVEPNILRIFCRKCKQVFTAKVKRCGLRMVQKKVLQRKCLFCCHSQNYQCDKNYLSRNERFWKKQGFTEIG